MTPLVRNTVYSMRSENNRRKPHKCFSRERAFTITRKSFWQRSSHLCPLPLLADSHASLSSPTVSRIKPETGGVIWIRHWRNKRYHSSLAPRPGSSSLLFVAALCGRARKAAPLSKISRTAGRLYEYWHVGERERVFRAVARTKTSSNISRPRAPFRVPETPFEISPSIEIISCLLCKINELPRILVRIEFR